MDDKTRIAELEAENTRLRLELQAERKQRAVAEKVLAIYRAMIDEASSRTEVIR